MVFPQMFYDAVTEVTGTEFTSCDRVPGPDLLSQWLTLTSQTEPTSAILFPLPWQILYTTLSTHQQPHLGLQQTALLLWTPQPAGKGPLC